MAFGYDDEEKKPSPEKDQAPENAPIEPEQPHARRFGSLKIFFSVLVMLYLIFSFFREPILIRLGEYLAAKDRLEKADLIVCLAGNGVERGLATIDAYRQGLAPYIYTAREEPPDGYEALKAEGLHYPEQRDLLLDLFREAGIPDSVLLPETGIVLSTFDEAQLVGELVRQKKYRSLIVITSPTHCRRALLTFKNRIGDSNVKVMMFPSPYSRFNPQTWWKERKYAREVLLEYEKLIYYAFKYFF